MIDKCVQKDLGYYSTEIIKDKEGKPLVIVKFKFTDKPSWVYSHSWCPTLEELEFLYNTKKMMEHTKNMMNQSK
jgi:hypothetical protein